MSTGAIETSVKHVVRKFYSKTYAVNKIPFSGEGEMIAAIYGRKGADQSGVSDEQESVARQIDHARGSATRKGWAVDEAHVYTDDGISRAEFDKRPGFVQLLKGADPRAPAFRC
jgi:ABC-type Na+ transport system ATPase subunit NatA